MVFGEKVKLQRLLERHIAMIRAMLDKFVDIIQRRMISPTMDRSMISLHYVCGRVFVLSEGDPQ